MKIYVEQDTNKLFLPKDYASLEQITSNGDFVYKFVYGVNLSELLKATGDKKGYTVRISVVKNSPEKLKPTIFEKGHDPKSIISNLQKQSSLQKDINRSQKKNILSTKLSDITKKIPNDQLKDINRALKNNFENIPGIKKYFSYSVLPTDQLKSENINAPVLEMNLNKSKDFEIDATSGMIREESLKLIHNYFLDPAEFVGQKSNTISPAIKQHSGVITKGSWFLKNQFNSDEFKTNEILLKSLLTNNNVSSYSEIPSAEHANIITKIEDTNITIEETMLVSRSLLDSDNFILMFELLTSNNLVVQQLSEIVSHSQLVGLIQSPTLPPKIKVVDSVGLGKNSIYLSQRDPLATAITVFKKPIKTDSYSLDSEYQKVATINLEHKDAEIIINDNDVSPNPVIYRAIAIGPNGLNGSDFSSFVVKPKKIKNSLDNSLIFKRPSHVVLTNEIRETKNLILIDNIPEQVFSVELYRRDMTIKGNWEKVGPTIPLKHIVTRPVEFSDTRLKKKRIYEYACWLTYFDGHSAKAGNNLVIEYNPVETNIVDVRIENLKIDSNNYDDADVLFDIRKSIILNQTDILKSLLVERGITEFNGNLEENKHLFSDLFAIKIERTNLNNGQKEDFGVIDGLSFSDKTFGKIKNVSQIQANTSYKYEVSTYARSAETLINNLTRSVDVRNTSYSLKPSKYLHPVTLTDGNITTDASYKNNHAFSQFTVGKLCDIKYVEVSFNEALPKILDVKASKINNKKIAVNWSIQGNSSKFDHFIVVLEINGMRTVVGKAHGSDEKNNYQFIDNLDNNEHGSLEYIVIPVYYDFTRGNENRASVILI